MASSFRLAILAIVAGGLGFWLAKLTSRPFTEIVPTCGPSAEVAQAPPREEVAPPPGRERLAELRLGENVLQAMRTMIREELASVAAAQAHSCPNSMAVANETDEGMTPERIPDYDKARSLVSEAVATGTWTPRDRDRLQELTASLPPAMSAELISPLIIQMNGDKIRLQGFNGEPPL